MRIAQVLALSLWVGWSGLTTADVSAAPPAEFTYQGFLKDGAVPVTGPTTLEFTLWNSESEGEQVAEPVRTEVSIKNGLFAVELDFGMEAFRGEPRWLEISVRTERTSATLSPRQKVTSAPSALYALDSRGGSGGGLVLPYGGTTSSTEVAFAVGQTGLAGAGGFAVDNANNTQPALTLMTNGSGPGLLSTTASGPAIWGRTGVGGGNAGYFETLGTDNTQPALGAENKAAGPAAHFRTTKLENTNPTLVVETFSDGPAATFTTHDNPNNSNLDTTVEVENQSFGSAGQFALSNSQSTADALKVNTIAGGSAIHAYTNGTGRAGFFEVDNFGQRTVPAFEVVSNGRGAGAGFFQTTIALNTAAALSAESTGDADAILSTAKGLGTAVKAYNAFGGSAVVGLVEGETGKAGSFTSTHGSNTAPALEATTSGAGPAARFSHTATDGQAADFIGEVTVAGTVEADAYTYRQPREHYLSLTPFDFTPNDSQPDWSRFIGPPGGSGTGLGAQAGESLHGDQNFMCAPVHLPQGATVTRVQAHYYYRVPVFNVRELEVSLHRRLLWNGADWDMATLRAGSHPEDGNYSMESSDITDPVIDNREHGYWVRAGMINPCESEDMPCVHHAIYGAVITYTITEAE